MSIETLATIIVAPLGAKRERITVALLKELIDFESTDSINISLLTERTAGL